MKGSVLGKVLAGRGCGGGGGATGRVDGHCRIRRKETMGKSLSLLSTSKEGLQKTTIRRSDQVECLYLERS